jgi:hypothetical protein
MWSAAALTGFIAVLWLLGPLAPAAVLARGQQTPPDSS